jgi:hypothetical protein
VQGGVSLSPSGGEETQSTSGWDHSVPPADAGCSGYEEALPSEWPEQEAHSSMMGDHFLPAPYVDTSGPFSSAASAITEQEERDETEEDVVTVHFRLEPQGSSGGGGHFRRLESTCS